MQYSHNPARELAEIFGRVATVIVWGLVASVFVIGGLFNGWPFALPGLIFFGMLAVRDFRLIDWLHQPVAHILDVAFGKLTAEPRYRVHR